MTGPRVAAGLANWPALAATVGLPVEGWQATLLWSRQDARGDRTVIRLDRGGLAPVIVKQAHRQAEADGMAAGLVAQARAQQGLQTHPTARVPRILAHLPDRCAALIEAVPGLPLADVAESAALTRAGVWLDAFHRTAPLTKGPFWPRKAARRAFRAAEEMEAGRKALPKQRLFLSHLRSLRASAGALRGAEITIAPRHGDLSGRNMLIGDGFVWGIDFGPQREGATGLDIAKLLTFLAVRASDPLQGSLVAGFGSLQQTFFTGFKVTDHDEPTLPFLMRAGLLADWSGLPPDTAAMTGTQEARFRRIVALLADLAPDT